MAQTSTGNRLATGAHQWADRGVPVFPLHWAEGGACSCGDADCDNQAKHPLYNRHLGLVNGLHSATTDHDTITGWWAEYPKANIGAVTGVVFDAIDIDGGDAFPRWEQFKAEHGEPTWAGFATSGRTGGGMHIYCVPGGQQTVPKAKRGLPAGIEIKGVGGYVVAPPSVHVTGTEYRMFGDFDPENPRGDIPWDRWYADALTTRNPEPAAPPAPEPPKMVGSFSPLDYRPPSGDAARAYGDAVLRRAVGIVASAGTGGRWNALAVEAVPLAARGVAGGCIDRAEAERALADAARIAGLTEPEIRRVPELFDRFLRLDITHPIKPTGRPEPAPVWPSKQQAADTDWDPPDPLVYPVPAFPVETLGWLERPARDLAAQLQVPLDLVGMLCLAVVAATVRGRARVVVSPTWDEPLNIYVATVLGPGETKSPCVSALARKLRDLEAAERARMAPKIADAEDRHDVAERRLQAARANAAKKAGDGYDRVMAEQEVRTARQELAEAEVPPEPLWLAGDMTPEALVQKLAEQGGRLAHISAEGSLLDTIVGGRYSSGAGHITELLAAHDGREPIKVHRRHADDIEIHRPCLTLALAVQPQVLRTLGSSEAAMQRGLAARFLYAVPKSLVGMRDMRVGALASEDAAVAFDELVARLEDHFSSGDIEDTIHGGDVFSSPSFEDKEDKSYRYLLKDLSLSLFVTYREHLEKRRHPELGDLAGIGSWANKLDGQLARLAALLQLIDDREVPKQGSSPFYPQNVGGQFTVSEQAMARAIVLVDYLIEHAQEAHVLMGSDATRDMEPAKQLLGWITENVDRSTGVLHLRDAQQSLRRRSTFRDADTVKAAADLLANFGYLRRLPPAEHKPGRPSIDFLVHPDVLRGAR